MKMKTLYVSDLDGTLLNSNQEISVYTAAIIAEAVNRGILFSYATARSYYSAKPATQNLKAEIPVILYNGTFIKDSVTQEILVSNYFSKMEIHDLSHYFSNFGFYPIVYAMKNNQEKFSYYPKKSTQQEMNFVATRNDERKNPLKNNENLYDGDVFYFSCIGEYDLLKTFYEDLKDQYHCLLSEDIYSHDWWLEVLPKNVSKAQAILQLKDYLKCDRIVAFGDGINDLSMFQIADESYAVANACEELKSMATGIIGHHDDDAVAKWLQEFVISKL